MRAIYVVSELTFLSGRWTHVSKNYTSERLNFHFEVDFNDSNIIDMFCEIARPRSILSTVG